MKIAIIIPTNISPTLFSSKVIPRLLSWMSAQPNVHFIFPHKPALIHTFLTQRGYRLYTMYCVGRYPHKDDRVVDSFSSILEIHETLRCDADESIDMLV